LKGKTRYLYLVATSRFLIEKVIEGVRHSIEYITTIENEEVRRRVLSVFVFGIRSTLLLSVVFAGIAMMAGMFVTGERLTRTRVLAELDKEEIGQEDVAEPEW
jgi:hypothetical protein